MKNNNKLDWLQQKYYYKCNYKVFIYSHNKNQTKSITSLH